MMRILVLSCLLLTAVRPALAQRPCPDGTPPPCRSAPRLPAPRLDPNTWVVLPFANLTGQAELDRVGEGAALLLYGRLSRWSDLRVVDDAQVADEIDRRHWTGQRLTLTQARAIAGSFGAGTIVLGRMTSGAHSKQLDATLYDARSGRPGRRATVTTAIEDSVFHRNIGHLAVQLLALPANALAQDTLTITRSLDALREYKLGEAQERRYNSLEAIAHYRRATELDSTFALAYYAWWRAFTHVNWVFAPQAGRYSPRNALTTAIRHGAALPARERALIAAANQRASDLPGACAAYRDLVRRDSSDIDALDGFGKTCSRGDNGVALDRSVVRDPRSPSGYAFRYDWNGFLWANRRIVTVDSTVGWAYVALDQILTTTRTRPGCLDPPRCTQPFRAFYLWRGDSLITTPWPVVGWRAVGDTSTPAQRLAGARTSAEVAARLYRRYLSVDPGNPSARIYYTNALQALGRPEAALPLVRDLSGGDAWLPGLVGHLMEVLFALERPGELIPVFDSLEGEYRAAFARRDTVKANLLARTLALGIVLGRTRHVEWSRVPPGALTPWGAEFFHTLEPDSIRPRRVAIVLGVAPPQPEPWERDPTTMVPPSARLPDGSLDSTTAGFLNDLRSELSLFQFHARRQWLPHVTLGPTATSIPRFQHALMSGDTALARVQLAAMDAMSYLDDLPGTMPQYANLPLVAESHLELGDSSGALAVLRNSASKWREIPSGSWSTPYWWLPAGMAGQLVGGPRLWLLYGDVAYAMGLRDEAVRAYRFIADLWASADPEYQPTVQRVRSRLAELTRAGP